MSISNLFSENGYDIYANNITCNNITSDTINNISNKGTGSQIYIDKLNQIANIRSIKAGTNISVTQNAEDITISASGAPLDLVQSVFGRTGDVVAENGDYAIIQLSDTNIDNETDGNILVYEFATGKWINSDSYVQNMTVNYQDPIFNFFITGQKNTQLNYYLNPQLGNTVLAGPTSLGDGIPTFRQLVNSDIPQISYNSLSDLPQLAIGYKFVQEIGSITLNGVENTFYSCGDSVQINIDFSFSLQSRIGVFKNYSGSQCIILLRGGQGGTFLGTPILIDTLINATGGFIEFTFCGQKQISISAMEGAWYLSGNLITTTYNYLNRMFDTNIVTPLNNQLLQYSTINNKWNNVTYINPISVILNSGGNIAVNQFMNYGFMNGNEANCQFIVPIGYTNLYNLSVKINTASGAGTLSHTFTVRRNLANTIFITFGAADLYLTNTNLVNVLPGDLISIQYTRTGTGTNPPNTAAYISFQLY